jgi:hypothetical protein
MRRLPSRAQQPPQRPAQCLHHGPHQLCDHHVAAVAGRCDERRARPAAADPRIELVESVVMLSTVKRVGWMLNRDSTATGRDRSCCRGHRVGASYPAAMLARKISNRSGQSVRDTTLPPADTQSGILQRPYLWVTIGTCALVFLAAFESLAVTTIMPVVSRELHGAGPLRPGLRGPAGHRSDRDGGQPGTGPTAAAPPSPSMGPWRSSRGTADRGHSCVHAAAGGGPAGAGAGRRRPDGGAVCVVARIYPGLLHPKIFAAFSAAWVIPSLVGPFAAGPCGSGVQLALGVPGRGGAGHSSPGDDRSRPVAEHGPAAPGNRLTGTVPGATGPGAVGAGTAGLGQPWPRWPCWDSTSRGKSGSPVPPRPALLAVAAVVIALLAVRPLVPRGTLAARRGLPSVILVRGLRPPGSSAPRSTCRTC